MITDQAVAKQINDHLLQATSLMNASLELAQQECPYGEFAAFRDCVSKAMFDVMFEALIPLYRRHPELAPPWFRNTNWD
jgi:hypothetical protein